MSQHDIATAMQRARRVLVRRPETGLHDDAPAVARWQGGAARGIVLAQLEVRATSRSDLRGLLGMADKSDAASASDAGEGATERLVDAGPRDVELLVRLAAEGATPESLHELVEASQRCSPIPRAVAQATPIGLRVEVMAVTAPA